jgi:Predicted thioesterase
MFKKTFIPRKSEENRTGHIRSDVITIWLQEGSIDIFRMFNPDFRREPQLIMVSLKVDFMNEVLFGDNVEVSTWVKSISNSSFVLQQNVYQKEYLCATGLSTFVHLNYATHKSEVIPNPIRHMLAEHLLTDAS